MYWKRIYNIRSRYKREKRIKRKEIKWNNVGKEVKLEGLTREVGK